MNFENINFDPISLGIGLIIGLLIGSAILLWRRGSLKVVQDQRDRQLEALYRLEEDKKGLEERFGLIQQDLVRSQTEKLAFEQKIIESRADLNNMEKKFEAHFENLAHKIFEEKSQTFKKQSQEGLDILLSPLKDKINDFQKKVDDSFGSQAKEQFALKEQIKMIVDANDKITSQTQNLTDALKGDSKVQGDWGEIMLEKILEDVGLRKGEDYVLQASGMELKDSETGKRQKPDVVVNLPDNKHVVIDSKVSLTSYERFFNETDDALRSGHLKKHLTAVRNRVDELKDRRYQYTDKLDTPEFVLMFIPIESAYMLALQEDRSLHQYAWEKGVAIVCPSTLFSSLNTIASLWKLVRQNKNAEEIAKKGGDLYDKISGFVSDMQTLGKNLKTLETTYDGAMNKLTTGRGNILGRTEALKKLGAKASKSLPVNLLESENTIEANDDEAA